MKNEKMKNSSTEIRSKFDRQTKEFRRKANESNKSNKSTGKSLERDKNKVAIN